MVRIQRLLLAQWLEPRRQRILIQRYHQFDETISANTETGSDTTAGSKTAKGECDNRFRVDKRDVDHNWSPLQRLRGQQPVLIKVRLLTPATSNDTAATAAKTTDASAKIAGTTTSDSVANTTNKDSRRQLQRPRPSRWRLVKLWPMQTMPLPMVVMWRTIIRIYITRSGFRPNSIFCTGREPCPYEWERCGAKLSGQR